MRPRRLGVAALVLFLLAGPAVARPALPDFAPGGPVALDHVIDGETLALGDGRTLRLVGIDVPAVRGDSALAAAAQAALEQLVADKPLALRFAGNAEDRNGRVLAALFAGKRWVQRELVRRGLARVRGAADNRIGLAALLAAEATARKAKRGLWRLPRFAVRQAEDAARDTGSWQIVEGKVEDATAAESGLFLTFGPDWHTAFGAHLSRDALKLFRADGIDPKSLKGARLRIRGFIDGTTRPTVEVAFPEQIEPL